MPAVLKVELLYATLSLIMHAITVNSGQYGFWQNTDRFFVPSANRPKLMHYTFFSGDRVMKINQ